MNTLNLKPQHQDSVIGRLLSLKSQKDYQKNNIVSELPFMEKWEAKEYRKIIEDTDLEFEEAKKYVLENEDIFNNILINYNLSVAVFMHKYIIN